METASQRASSSPRPAARRRAPSRGEQPFADSSGSLSRQFSDTTFLGDEGQIELRGRSRGSSGLSQVDDSPPRRARRDSVASGRSGASLEDAIQPLQDTVEAVERAAARRGGTPPSPSRAAGAGESLLRTASGTRPDEPLAKVRTLRADTQDGMKQIFSSDGRHARRRRSRSRAGSISSVGTNRSAAASTFSMSGQQPARTSRLWPNRGGRSGTVPARSGHAAVQDWMAKAEVPQPEPEPEPEPQGVSVHREWPPVKGSAAEYEDRQLEPPQWVEVTVVKVDHECAPPAYTIKLPGGNERGTELSRLRRVGARPSEPERHRTRPARSYTAEDRWQSNRRRNMGRGEDGRAAGAPQERELAQRQRQQDREREERQRRQERERNERQRQREAAQREEEDRLRAQAQAEDKRRWLASEEAKRQKADEERRRRAAADKASREKLQHSEAEAKRRADKKVQERDAEIRRLSEEKQKLEAEHSAKMAKMSKRLGKEEGATRRERERAASEATRARQDSWVATKRGDEREAAKARYDKTPQLSLAVLRASCLPLIPRLFCAQ